jgi:hypothetical protein
MAEDKKKKGVMDDILGSKEQDDTPGMEALDSLIYRRGKAEKKPVSLGKRGPARPARKSLHPPLNKKVTHYLSEKVSVELGEAKAMIKVMVPPEIKSQLSMSRIVDYALKAILKELETKGTDSALVQEILKGELNK